MDISARASTVQKSCLALRHRAFALALLFVAAPALAQPVIPLAAIAGAVGTPPDASTPEQVADLGLVAGPMSPGERLAAAERDQTLDPFLAFGPVLGPEFTAAQLPETASLLSFVYVAVVLPLLEAKDLYPRDRPYAADPQNLRCPRAGLDDDSWPSGHAAMGIAWALVLVDLYPGRAQALIERGADYGWSRVVCGVHWPSDVAAGQRLGAAVVALLRSDAEFRTALEAARRETLMRPGLPEPARPRP